MKLLLWLLVGLGTLLAGVVALLWFVDVNLYRDRIEQQVSAALGREVVLAGQLGLEPSLSPRFTVNGLKISNPDWASRPFLAIVDKFDIRVSLLPLLRGDLEIVALEFHGIDLLLEETADGDNNFTFDNSGEAAELPVVKRFSLFDTAIAYSEPGEPLRRIHLAQVTARKIPGQPVELDAQTTLNELPVTISLRGEPGEDEPPHGPWKVTLLGESGDISLRIAGSLVDPADWKQGEYRLELGGRHLDRLEILTGVILPDTGPYELAADIRFSLNKYLSVSNLSGQLDDSDISGDLYWDKSVSPQTLKVRLDSRHLDVTDLVSHEPPAGTAEQEAMDVREQPLDLGVAGAIDLDIEVQLQRLTGLEKPLQDIALTIQADRQQLRLAAARATLEDTTIAADAALPWGEQLAALGLETASMGALLQHAELDISAKSRDTVYRYETMLAGEPLELTLSSINATVQPGSEVTIRGKAALNNKPVTVTLQGEPLAALLQHPTGPWSSLALEVRSDVIRIDASGSVARPLEAGGFDVRYSMNGPDIGALLPLQGAWSLDGHYAERPDRHVINELKARVGKSDIGGRVTFYPGGPRARLVADLEAGQIHVDDLQQETAGETSAAEALNQPLDIGGLGAVDLDIGIRIRRFEGLEKPLQDIRVSAQANARDLTLAPFQASLDGIQIDARAQLPWGRRLATLARDGVSIQQLARYADLALQAQAPAGKLSFPTAIMGHPVELELAGLEASARPGDALQVSAKARLDEEPVRLNLQAEPLADLLQLPTGPWQDLTLKIQGGDIRFEASGRVDRPFEARGFDIRYALQGAEIDTLTPLLDLILPLEGAYSLTGHFADLPDRKVFDELKITSGQSDIGGHISVYPGDPRPRLVVRLHSEQIYLRELLPVSETTVTPGAEPRVIPEYDLPLERMRAFDGELEFRGKRLRTVAGDLGDISFRVTLEDGVFRLDPFTVRGWAGGLIEADATVDASQDPPPIDVEWIARQLNYGMLLKQAGLSETVTGTLDITLRLSGSGRTRHEFLGDADGQLIIVGEEGRFGSRRLDLWGSDLVTTMLSRDWRRDDVTNLNCLVARVTIEDGIARSDELLVDTRRITIGAAGTLDLEREALNFVFAPRPKRASLVSITSPVRVTGTLATPEVAVTVLPRNRMAAAGTGLLAGLVNPGYLIFTFSQTGSGVANPCAAAVEQAMIMKGRSDELDGLAPAPPPKRFSLLPGCTRQRPAQR